MNIDHAESGNGQQVLGNDAAVRGDDADVGVPGAQRPRSLRRLQAIGLKYRNLVFDGQCLHGRKRDLLPAAARTIGLRDDARDGV